MMLLIPVSLHLYGKVSERSASQIIWCLISAWDWWLSYLFDVTGEAGATADGNVTLVSLTIFTTHEWYYKPDVYFQCQGEERKDLPDVKDKDRLYKFIGEESWQVCPEICYFHFWESVWFDTLLGDEHKVSLHICLAWKFSVLWSGSGLFCACQPLTSLVGVKCKRCGLYEKDKIKSDDIFDEWELCPLDFSRDPDVHYFHSKDKEFNMTLSCPQCSKIHFPALWPSDHLPTTSMSLQQHSEGKHVGSLGTDPLSLITWLTSLLKFVAECLSLIVLGPLLSAWFLLEFSLPVALGLVTQTQYTGYGYTGLYPLLGADEISGYVVIDKSLSCMSILTASEQTRDSHRCSYC